MSKSSPEVTSGLANLSLSDAHPSSTTATSVGTNLSSEEQQADGLLMPGGPIDVSSYYTHMQEMVQRELNRVPAPVLQKLKQELNMSDKEVSDMTLEEKQALVTRFRINLESSQTQRFFGEAMPAIDDTTLSSLGPDTSQVSPMNPRMASSIMGAPGQGELHRDPRALMYQYRQAVQTIHKPPHLQQMLPAGVLSPSASDAHGGGMPGGHPPELGNRQPQAKPVTGMMPPPPPSPAMSAKTPGGPTKQEDGGPPPNGRIDASPQNAAAGIGGQAPGQPGGPGGPGGPGQTAASTPAPPTPTASAMTAPSPSAILNASTPNMSNHPPPPPPPAPATDGLDPNPFGIDFAAGFGDFDPNLNLLNGDSSLNFERDFAAWFDPENA